MSDQEIEKQEVPDPNPQPQPGQPQPGQPQPGQPQPGQPQPGQPQPGQPQPGQPQPGQPQPGQPQPGQPQPGQPQPGQPQPGSRLASPETTGKEPLLARQVRSPIRSGLASSRSGGRQTGHTWHTSGESEKGTTCRGNGSPSSTSGLISEGPTG